MSAPAADLMPPEAALHPEIARSLCLAARAVGIDSPFARVAVGGNGIVFSAGDRAGRRVIVKIPRYDLLAPERIPIARNGLKREAQVLGAIATPHVPQLVCVDHAGRYLIRQFIDGRLLESMLSDPTITVAQRLSLLRSLLEAAAGLFQQFHDWRGGCYVIRDFKPRNLVVRSRDASIVLVDTGSIRSEKIMLSSQRRTHRIGAGAWRYWPPEQILEETSLLDRRVDYFALGCTLYAVIFGDSPYRNQAPACELHAAYDAEYKDAITRLEAAEWIPDSLRRYVGRCLSPDPRPRPVVVPDAFELGL